MKMQCRAIQYRAVEYCGVQSTAILTQSSIFILIYGHSHSNIIRFIDHLFAFFLRLGKPDQNKRPKKMHKKVQTSGSSIKKRYGPISEPQTQAAFLLLLHSVMCFYINFKH